MSLLNPVQIKRPPGDEAEKPFWISYADLMTSLMVLFLVVMLASLASLTRTVTDLQDTKTRSEELAGKYKDLKRREARERRLEGAHRADIASFWKSLEKRSRGLGINVNRRQSVVDFGDRARFATGSDRLNAADQLLLRRFTPGLLAIAD